MTMKTILTAAMVSILGFLANSQTILKGPYLLYPNDNTKMTVMWQSDAFTNSVIYWDTTLNYGNSSSVTEFGNDHQFKYIIQNLIPAQKYFYKVECGTDIKTGSFMAAPDSNAKDVSFYIYGDTRSHPENQNTVTERILSEINNDPASQTFCIFTGDCVTRGNVESNWQNEYFNSSYLNNEKLKSMLPYLIARGNHENDGANSSIGNATVFYKYWPYTFVDGSTDGDNMYYSFDYGSVHVAVVDQYDNGSYNPAELSSVQLAWLQNDLASSDKTWKFILLHEPGWSAKYTVKAEHGNNADVQSNIQPLCTQNNVKAVFAGHNHYYAHCKVDSVNHFTLGGGGAPLYTPSNTSGGVLVYAESTFHFMKVQIHDNNATLTAIRPDGSVIETTNLHMPTSGVSSNIINKIKVYPNPSNGIFSVQILSLSNADLYIYDMFGRKILKKKLTSKTNNIDISNFKEGVYLMSVKINDQIIQKKLVLK